MEIEKKALTKDVLTSIMEIDNEFYKDDKTTLDWYLSRYTDKHVGYLIKDGEEVVGYFVCVPIKKALYNAIINGVLVNDIYINPQMFIAKSKYNYIVSFVMKKGYRHHGVGSELIKSLLKNVKRGCYCALTISKDGYNIASKYMKKKLVINDEITVFEIKF